MIKNAIVIIKNEEYYDDTQLLIRSFFKGVNIIKEQCFEDLKRNTDVSVKVRPHPGAGVFFLSSDGSGPDTDDPDTVLIDTVIFEPDPDVKDQRRGSMHDHFKRGLYNALTDLTGRTLPWGFLTGVRPAKRAMEFISSYDGDINKVEIISAFSEKYMTSEKKARLALDVALNETEILNDHGISYDDGSDRGFSVYVGIPFCPTTCLYCSFPSIPMDRCDQKLISDYMRSLCFEIRESRRIYSERFLKKGCDTDGLQPSSVYIGGGTPTALSAQELEELIACIKNCFIIKEDIEFCVEAGRPDSITAEKLQVLKSCGVNRISVNPQSMNPETLEIIGRDHTPEDIFIAFEMARSAGFDNINTDIILGLPEEGVQEVKKTLDALKKLKPEGLTVHSLALKRASRLKVDADNYKDLTLENSEEIMDMTSEFAESLGMRPYYMYRQQNMAGNFENTGYALRGKESLYNIVIMEEIQDILAMGAGASSKFMMGNNRFERASNVKDVVNYIKRTDEMCRRKKMVLDGQHKNY